MVGLLPAAFRAWITRVLRSNMQEALRGARAYIRFLLTFIVSRLRYLSRECPLISQLTLTFIQTKK